MAYRFKRRSSSAASRSTKRKGPPFSAQILTPEGLAKARDSFVRNVLREASVRWPGRTIADRNASVGFGQRRCAHCQIVIPANKRKLDHIEPVVDPTRGFVDWDTFIVRLFIAPDGFQVLCVPCHNIKSKEEIALAVERRKLEKAKLPPKKPARGPDE